MSRTYFPSRVVLCLLVFGSLASAQSPSLAPGWMAGRVVVQVSEGGSTPLAPNPDLFYAIIFDPRDDIFSYSSPGSSLRKITQGVDPALSPDGGMVVFCGFPPGQIHSQLMIVKSDGGGQKQLTNMEGSPCAPAWSPDGKKIAFHAATNRGQVVMVLDFAAKTITPIAIGSLPRWSPDGKRLLFLRKPEMHDARASIWTADSDGKNARFLVDSFSPVPAADWSGDGQFIIYTNDDHHQSAIFRVNLDGTNPEKIAGNKNVEMYFPSMSPDGRQLVVVRAYGPAVSLVLIDLSTQKERWLANGVRGDVSWVKHTDQPSSSRDK